MVRRSDASRHGSLLRMTHSMPRSRSDPHKLDTTRIKAYTWIGATFESSGSRRTDPSWTDDLYFISVAARMLGMHPADAAQVRAARAGPAEPDDRQHAASTRATRLERLRVIKRLVDEAGINLAGVQRLLSIAEVVQRIRPLMRDEPLSRDAEAPAARRTEARAS